MTAIVRRSFWRFQIEKSREITEESRAPNRLPELCFFFLA
jgi:hypothetical protein